MEGQRPGTRCVYAGPMARHDPASLLQLSRYGWARHNFHCRDAVSRANAVARETLRFARDALGAHGLRAAAVHCEYRRMDDRGTRPAALAYLRADAHRARRLATGRRRECLVHADWFHGLVYRDGYSVVVSRLSRNRGRAGV